VTVDAIVGTQMYTWLQWYREQNKDLLENLDEALGMVADAGLAAVEHGIGNEREADQWAQLLQKHKLKMPSMYTGGVLHIAEWRKSADAIVKRAQFAKKVGAKTISVNPDPLPRPANRNKNDEELRRQAEAMSYLTKALKDEGFTLAYHTHDPEMRAAAREFHHTVIATQGAGMRLCLDAHWVYRGAENSQVALEDIIHLYGDRIAVVHLRQSKNGVWTEHLMPGDVDYTPLAHKLQAMHFDGPLYIESAFEQGTPRTMSIVESHRKSREWVKNVFGV
jgi:inosose dehydratase